MRRKVTCFRPHVRDGTGRPVNSSNVNGLAVGRGTRRRTQRKGQGVRTCTEVRDTERQKVY